jgi:lipoprotein-releasing system permease protein
MAERRADSGNLSARMELASGVKLPRAQPPRQRSTHPFAAFEWMIAMRYIRPSRREGYVSIISILSLIGIALGVAALIIVLAVMNGFRHELLSRILGLQGHAEIQSLYGNMPNYDAQAAKIRAVPGVTRVAPVVDGQVMASANGLNGGVLVRGMRQQDLRTLTIVYKSLSKGALAHFQGGDAVIIGARLAEKLRLLPGQQITLIAPRGNVTPFGTTPRVKSYTVAGTFRIGMTEYDQTFVFMPLDEAQLYFNLDNRVSGLEVMVKDPDAINNMVGPLAAAAGPYSRVITWQDMQSSLFGALEVERNVMALILALIVLVAALNIISGLIMLVKDKAGDIAILRTMGASRGAIMRVFFIAGASIGVTGTLLGFVFGVVFCTYIEDIRQALSKLLGTTLFDPTIYFLSRIPAEMDAGEVSFVVVLALALSFLATLYPSWRAARLDPVEALRYE